MKKSKIERCVSAVVISVCLIKAVLYGGSKPPMPTNPPPDDVSSPTNAPMMCAGSLRGRGLSQTSQVDQPSIASGGLGNPAAPVMFEVITNWTARGAYCDWQPVTFSDGFQFPVGTNFIDSVMLMAYGEIKSNLHCSTSTSDFDFSLPSRVSLEPGVSSVSHGLTASNSYLFAWHNCCVERCATNRVDASIELFRSGAVAIRTTSTVQPSTFDLQPPIVPEGYYGHGQDEDWIRATFPGEADNILMSGYAAWLAQWVGENEQNGRYLARVTINQPPATTNRPPIYLTCGPYRVNVAAPGTYSFPLEVFETYEVRTYPTAVPFTVDFDDGYTGGGQSYEIVEVPDRPRLLMMGPASQTLTFYRFYMKPLVIVSPGSVPLSTANGTRLSLWSNISNITRRFCNAVSTEFYLNFCFPSDAEIINAEVAETVEIILESSKGSAVGYLDIVDDSPDEPEVPEVYEREDASIFSGESLHSEVSNECVNVYLTAVTAHDSTTTNGAATAYGLAEGQSADVFVYMATSESGDDDYDDAVGWTVTANGTVGLQGESSVSSHATGAGGSIYGVTADAILLASGHFTPPPDDILRLRLQCWARNVGDGKRETCVQILVVPRE